MDARGLFIGVIKFKASLNNYPSSIAKIPYVANPTKLKSNL